MFLPAPVPLLRAGEVGLCWKEFNQITAAPHLAEPWSCPTKSLLSPGCWEGWCTLGKFEVGESKCALRDHSDVPGGTGAGLSLEALAGGKVGESPGTSYSQCSTGVVTTCDGWAQVCPYSSPLPWFQLVPIWLLSAFGFTTKVCRWSLLILAPQSPSPQPLERTRGPSLTPGPSRALPPAVVPGKDLRVQKEIQDIRTKSGRATRFSARVPLKTVRCVITELRVKHCGQVLGFRL